jgi:Flp pilus assembly pilin Flp
MNLDMIVAYVRARLGVTSEKGQTLVEYALIISLIAIVAVGALAFLSGKINAIFSKSGSKL